MKEDELDTNERPWKNLSLVLSASTSQFPVDPIEGHVFINPSDVELRWSQVFSSIDNNVLVTTAAISKRLQTLRQNSMKYLSSHLRSILKKEMLAHATDGQRETPTDHDKSFYRSVRKA